MEQSLTRDREVKALIDIPDPEIDTTDIPEVLDWSNAVSGKFYRPKSD